MTDWNKLAEEYSQRDIAHEYMDWKLGYSCVLSMLKDSGYRGLYEKKILDYGCGSGKFSRELRKCGAKVLAVDSSEKAIEIARHLDETEGHTKNPVIYSLIEDKYLPLILKRIHAAVATFVFCTIKEESKIEKIVKKIYDSLWIGGKFVILDPHPDALGYKYIGMEREKPEELKSGIPIKVKLKGMETEFYDYWRPIEDYKRILKNAGFVIDVTREPIITDDRDRNWKDEKVQSPYLIIRARKRIIFP